MLPGQSQAVSPLIAVGEMVSIFFCICFANFWTKKLTNCGMSSLRSRRGGIRIGKHASGSTNHFGTHGPQSFFRDRDWLPLPGEYSLSACECCLAVQIRALVRRATALAESQLGCLPLRPGIKCFDPPAPFVRSFELSHRSKLLFHVQTFLFR